MLLNTLAFAAFFSVVLGLYYWRRLAKFQWVVLLIAGYYFYASWIPAYLFLLMGTTLINYWLSLRLAPKFQARGRNICLALCLNLILLFVFKYFNFFAISFHLPLQFKLLLPLGISFYTFQTLGYLIDIYRGKQRPEKHLGYMALFVSFFPLMAAGPIERGGELLPQLRRPQRLTVNNLVSGLKLFTFGMLLKMVVADNLGLVVDHVYAHLSDYKGMSLILTSIAFSWQIYADFAGYTAMARGVARMMGIQLVPNFNWPYAADSVRNFWQRWHMSLSRWFRDYLYIPLGGNRKGLLRTVLNTMIVFTLCGLWHGSSWNFIIWGVLHGAAISIERMLHKIAPALTVPKFVGQVYTFSFVTAAWVFFRAPTVPDALYVFRNALIGLRSFIRPTYLAASLNQLFDMNSLEVAIAGSLLVFIVLLDYVARRLPLGYTINKQAMWVRYSLYILVVVVILQLRVADIKEFIYVRF